MTKKTAQERFCTLRTGADATDVVEDVIIRVAPGQTPVHDENLAGSNKKISGRDCDELHTKTVITRSLDRRWPNFTFPQWCYELS